MPRHVIKKQVLELALPSAAAARWLQDTVSRVYRESVVPVIERCCNEAGSGDLIARFDSLSIDVGSIPVSMLETEMPARTEARLRDLLKKNTDFPENEKTPGGMWIQGAATVPARVSRRELLDYFIDNGTLPWWADEMETKGLEEDLQRLVSTSPDDVAAIVTRIVADTAKLKRLIYQFSDRVLLSVAKAMLRRFHTDIRRFLPAFIEAFLAADFRGKLTRKEIRLALWGEVFPVIVHAPPGGAAPLVFGDELLMRFSKRLGAGYRALAETAGETAEGLGDGGLYLRRVLSALTRGTPREEKHEGKILQQITSPEQLPEEALSEAKNGTSPGEQQDEIRKFIYSLIRLRRKLHQQGSRQKNGLKNHADLFERVIETFIKLAEARLPVSGSNKAPAVFQRISRELAAKRSFLFKELLREMEIITGYSTGGGIPTARLLHAERLMNVILSLQRNMISAEKAHLSRHLEALANGLSSINNIGDPRRYASEDKRNDKPPAMPRKTIDEILGDNISPDNIASSERRAIGDKQKIGEIPEVTIFPDNITSSKRNPVEDKQKIGEIPEESVSPEKPADFTSIAGLYRQVQLSIAALRQDIHFYRTGRQFCVVKSRGNGIEPGKKQASGDKRTDGFLGKYDEILALLEKFVSLAHPGKEVISLVARVIRSISDNESFPYKNGFQQLLHELKAALRTQQQDNRRHRAAPERDGQPANYLPEDELKIERLKEANMMKRGKLEKGILMDADDESNYQRRTKLTGEEKNAAMQGETSRVKADGDITPAGQQRTGLEKSIQDKDRHEVNLIQEPRDKLKDQADSLKRPPAIYQTPDGTSGKAKSPPFVDTRRPERDALKSTFSNVPVVGVNNRARYDDFSGKRGVVGRHLDSRRHEPIDESKEMYIQNAGLVILWPFLIRFFESTGLVKEGIFTDAEASERAVHLLQYLVDGSLETPEYMLSLNKVLCGRPMAEPVAIDFEITEKESLEAEALLQSVIQNWPALGKISVAGLRVAFLQRRGVLVPRNDDWLVRVERQTHDILLDRLDWTISVIRLPWLNNIIYTEW